MKNKYLIQSKYGKLAMKKGKEYGLRLTIKIGNGRSKEALEKLLDEIKPICEKIEQQYNKKKFRLTSDTKLTVR